MDGVACAGVLRVLYLNMSWMSARTICNCGRKKGLPRRNWWNIFAQITRDAHRHAEVTIRNMNQHDRELFTNTKHTELDRWVSNAVYKVARRAGVPKDMIMPEGMIGVRAIVKRNSII